MDWDIKWEAIQAHKITEMTMVPTGLVGRALELESKQQPAGSPPVWLTRPLLFTKRDACERQMDCQHASQAHFPPLALVVYMMFWWLWFGFDWSAVTSNGLCLHLWQPAAFSSSQAFIWTFPWFLTSGLSVITEAGIRSLPYNQSWPLITGLSKLIQCHREIYHSGVWFRHSSPWFLSPSILGHYPKLCRALT